ncbi:hypothetical protein VI817_008272 [Penicillium citrinum]|nr:hypothetical protein VI817_008272 [Penicillium citrinum]
MRSPSDLLNQPPNDKPSHNPSLDTVNMSDAGEVVAVNSILPKDVNEGSVLLVRYSLDDI